MYRISDFFLAILTKTLRPRKAGKNPRKVQNRVVVVVVVKES